MLRGVAVLLLAGACIVHLGVTIPGRDRAAAIEREIRRLTDVQRSAGARLANEARRAAARGRAADILALVPALSKTDPLTELRGEVLASVLDRPLGQVRLQVRPERAPVGAAFRISAVGRFEEVLAFSGELARPEAGIVFDRVQFRSGPRGIQVDLEALRLEGPR